MPGIRGAGDPGGAARGAGGAGCVGPSAVRVAGHTLRVGQRAAPGLLLLPERRSRVHGPYPSPEAGVSQPGCPALSGSDNRAGNVNSVPGTAWYAPSWPGQGNPGE